jgi:enoyl-CoA hydratase
MSEVRYSVEENIAVITLDAPHRRNALTPSMAAEFVAALACADDDESVGAVVIGGGASFCSGADRGVLAQISADPTDDGNFHLLDGIYQAFVRLGMLRVATVAAVRGAAVGAGLNLLLAADLRIVARDAKFISGFGRIGIHPGGGHFGLLSRTSGPEASAAMALFDTPIDGARAVEIGLAWEAVDDAEVDAVAFEFARRAARDPMLARHMVASYRKQVSANQLPSTVGVEVERGAQMWSLRRNEAMRAASGIASQH